MSKLTIDIFVRLHKIFSDKRWMGRPGEDTVIENLCNLLSVMNDSEIELILELCERYEWYSYAEYGELVIRMFNALATPQAVMPTKIYLAPLKKLSDEGKTKSGDSLIYMLGGFIFALPKPFNNINLYCQISLQDLYTKKVCLKDNEKVFFLDDFLGSGQTFKSMMAELTVNETLRNENIRVMSLVAHQDGIDLLNEMAVPYSVSTVHHKGISDYYKEPLKSEKIEIMKKIEKNITTNKKYQFGFMQSEGIVTLIKTPNNTFPFFWMDYRTSKEILPSPFPRFQIEKLK